MAGCSSCGGSSSTAKVEPTQRVYPKYDPVTRTFTEEKIIVSKVIKETKKPIVKTKP